VHDRPSTVSSSISTAVCTHLDRRKARPTERQVETHWRDARLTTIFEGTSQVQQRIISDRLLPRPADR
jgi:hypothetical protein